MSGPTVIERKWKEREEAPGVLRGLAMMRTMHYKIGRECRDVS